MKRTNLVGFGIIILSLWLLASGCGSGSKATTGPQTPTSFQFTSPTSAPTIDAGQSVALTVNEPVTWSLQAASGKPVGALSNESSTGATYTAPSPTSVTGPTQVTVVATLVSDTTQSTALPVFINPVVTVNANFANKSCQYDPINGPNFRSSGTVGSQYSTLALADVGLLTGTAPFSWSISSGSLPVGLSLGQNGGNGGNGGEAYLYGIPVSAGCSQVAFQVTDAAGETATTATDYIIIAPPPLKIQVPNYTDSYSLTPYPPTALMVAGGVPPYRNWSVSGTVNTLPPGMTINPDTQNSAAAIITGTPNPACTPNSCQGYTPTIQVEDSQTPYPASGAATLNMYQWPPLPANACSPEGGIATSNPASLQGSYAFLVRGFDGNGPVVMAGSFVTDGAGNVTGGEEDMMRATGSQAAATITGGSYAIIQQGSLSTTFYQAGCVALTTATGTTTFAISLGGCSTSSDPTTGACVADAQGAAGLYTTGRLIEFDDSTGSGTRTSGIIRLQNSSALSGGLSGSYSFGLSGWDSAGSRYAAAGSMSASSSALSSVAADINDGGALQPALTGGSGTSSAADGNGRVAAMLTVGTASLNLAFYVVSAQEAIVVSTGAPSASNPVAGGEAISAAGPFSAASLQNSHMFHIAGSSPTGPDPSIGILSFDGVSGFTGTQYEDQAGTIGTTSLSGGYTVDASTGRVAFTAAPNTTQNLGDHPLVGYVVPVARSLTRQSCVSLASCVTGFLVSTDATAQAGQLEFQTPTIAPPPPFSNQYLTGYYFYGTEESLDHATALFAGASFANPTGAHYAGLQSASYPNADYCQQPACVLLVPNETLAASGAYSVNSNGTATIGGETVAVTNGNVTYYIDESPLNSHPSVIVVEQ